MCAAEARLGVEIAELLLCHSSRSSRVGLGYNKKILVEAVDMVPKKERDVEKAPQQLLPPLNKYPDVQTQDRSTFVRSRPLLGFLLVAIIFAALRTASIVPTSFKGWSGAWSRVCKSDHGWLTSSVINIKTSPEDSPNDPHIIHEIPQYVLDYAPFVHLYSEEQFWPCDIKEHLFHVTPELNYTPIQGLPQLDLADLDELNHFERGRHVFLTSNDNVESRPDWLGGEINIPDKFADDAKANHFDIPNTEDKTRKQSHGGHSDAPAVLLTVDKGDGIVDAFWFFFYSYNLGNLVFNIRFGNHVGDWEHTLVRFENGRPKFVFVSEHFFGTAYTYSAVEKIGDRVSMDWLLVNCAR